MSSSVNNNQRRFGTAIIGAGIHGVHILTRLVDDDILPPEDILLIDPHGQPAGEWYSRTAGCGMRFLRSPGSHGISRDFRTIRRTAGSGEDDFVPPYHRPSTTIFARHLQEGWRRSSRGVTVIVGRTRRIAREWGDPGEEASGMERGFVIESECPDGVLLHRARTVILAPGQPEPEVPPVLDGLHASAPVFHVYHPDFSPEKIESGARVAVVGGGIAAAHLIADSQSRGGTVDFWNRDRATSWQFDSDPCFIGPRCGTLFSALSSPRQRRLLLSRARRRGSLPPDLYEMLSGLIGYGRVAHIPAAVTGASVAGRGVCLSGSIAGRPVFGEYDLVVACTGFGAGPPAKVIVDQLARELRLPLHDGYPLPQEDLSWSPGLYVTGALGELVTGPPARNIIGAHLAARRMMPSLARFLSSRHGTPSTPI
jgi:hypothetical protein